MKITNVKTIIGFGVTNIDVYRKDLSEQPSETAVRGSYAVIKQRLDEREQAAGDKYQCSDLTEFSLFYDPFMSVETTSSPGGSIFNTFCGIGKSLCGIQPILVSFLGNGMAAPIIREACDDNHVVVVEMPVPEGYTGSINIPRNLMVQPPEGGERTLVKSPSEVVRPAFTAFGVPDELVDSADAMFVQGASIMRVGMDYLQTISSQLERRSDKFVVFSLPTVKKYEKDFIESKDGNKPRVETIREFAFQKANIISSTKDEFKALFGPDFDKGVQALQDGWKKNPRGPDTDPRLALITDGGEGAILIIEGRKPVRIAAIPDIQPAHKVGAGDATLAGFIAGLKAGLSPVRAANLAMNYGAIKTEQLEKKSVIKDPIASLRQRRTRASRAYLQHVRRTQLDSRKGVLKTAER